MRRVLERHSNGTRTAAQWRARLRGLGRLLGVRWGTHGSTRMRVHTKELCVAASMVVCGFRAGVLGCVCLQLCARVRARVPPCAHAFVCACVLHF